MPSKICKACSHQNHFRSTKCKLCNAPLAKSPGRTLGTTAAQGYSVGRSGGRPRDTSATEGYGVSPGRRSGSTAAEGSNVGRAGGRPTGTSAAEGYGVSTGRPSGTSAAEGCSVGRLGGRPTGTSAAEGFSVGRLGGRPTSTSAAEGYNVGRCGGKGKHGKSITFLDDIDLPTEWDTSHVNLDADLLSQCRSLIMQQRPFDRKSLGVGVCYNCGHVLWSVVDGAHTFLVDKPSNMTREEAPASAYLRAVPNCSLSFVYSGGRSKTKERWYCCSYCKSASVPTEMHVGRVFGADMSDVKPVPEWDMTIPYDVIALCNKYETGQVSLCGLFSDTVKKASMSQYHHLQGEINAIAKLDRHYHGLFGFIAVKDSDIYTHSPDPSSSLRIKKALKWFRTNNHLYTDFYAYYETLLRHFKPNFITINPDLLEQQNISLEKLLEDEAAGMAFPVDATYFDNFPLVRGEPLLGPSDKAGKQFPKAEQDALRDLGHASYGAKYLDCKAFPHLHPYGHGGWYHKCPMAFQAHIKMGLFDIRGLYAGDHCYCFFKYDYMVKVRMRMHNARN